MTFCFKVQIQLEFNKDDEVGKSKSLSSLFVCSKYLRSKGVMHFPYLSGEMNIFDRQEAIIGRCQFIASDILHY